MVCTALISHLTNDVTFNQDFWGAMAPRPPYSYAYGMSQEFWSGGRFGPPDQTSGPAGPIFLWGKGSGLGTFGLALALAVVLAPSPSRSGRTIFPVTYMVYMGIRSALALKTPFYNVSTLSLMSQAYKGM